MKIQNNKTKTATAILTALIIGLIVSSPSTIFPNVNATAPTHHIGYPTPRLTSSENQTVINAAMAIPQLQNWSHNWQFVDMAFLGNNKVGTPDFQWRYAIVDLKAPSSSAPIPCEKDWLAWVEIDMTTMKVVRATYPTMESHICHYATGATDSKHTWSIATQNDVNSTAHSYYGNYAELNLPSFSTNIYHDLNGWYIEQLVNAFFNTGTGCSSPNNHCIEQAGWLITNGTFTCVGCTSGAGKFLVYVDESKQNDESDHYTGLTWGTSATTLYGETDCAYSIPDYGITISNGTNSVTKTTSIPCSTTQWNTSPPTQGVENNSVFFENADKDSSSKWSGDITGTVSATNALEYKDSSTGTPVAWSTSKNVDDNCNGVTSTSQVLTGTLASGTTATWSYLSKQPSAC